jgi:hypothetical protein
MQLKMHRGTFMRSILLFAVLAVVLAGAANATDPAEVTTAPGAILCLSAENVEVANQGEVARSQTVLRGMGCLRVGPGIRSRMLDSDASAGPIRIRFYPAGISEGLVLWALPSALVGSDRITPPKEARQARLR